MAPLGNTPPRLHGASAEARAGARSEAQPGSPSATSTPASNGAAGARSEAQPGSASATSTPASDGAAGARSEAKPSEVKSWLLASRPRTLPAALAPVALGTSLALADGRAAALPAAAALVGALLLQIGANLANDVFDFEKGADTAERLGPPRVTQLGLLSPAAVRRGAALVFIAAGAVGLYLVALGGWPIALLGALAIAAGLAYTGGPYPLGYHGLGDLAVFAFFGVAAVCGTYWVQALALPPRVLAASVPMGALATAILAVNNLRDIATDARAGKRTLAVRWGPGAARLQYTALVLLAYATCPLLWLSGAAPFAVLLPLLTLPWALALVRRVAREQGRALNEVLAATARLELAFALLFAAGWLA
jgi:1,4-dihydroxy-2-naphthoate octaprenyltransferase